MRISLPALAAFVLSSGVSAQDHLVPPDQDILPTYHATLRRVLNEGYQPQVRARVLIVPSFRPERMIGLRQKGEDFEIFSVSPTVHIWKYEIINSLKEGRIRVISGKTERDSITELEKDLPKYPTEVPLKRCEVSIDASMAKAIISAWLHMLNSVQEDKTGDIILDGTGYYFSMPVNGHELVGEVSNPRTSSRTGKLVDLAYLKDEFCQTRRPKELRDLKRLGEEIISADE